MSDEYDDVLRARLARIDPVPTGSPVDPVTSPRAQELLERAMQTVDLPTDSENPSPRRRWQRPVLVAAAAAAVVALSVGTVLSMSSDDDGAPTRTTPTTVALTVPGGLSMSSCVPFDVTFLRDMPVALAGTVAAVDSRQVTLDVDRWYKGGTADQVTIAVPDGQSSAALDGVQFEPGKRYLLTATEGMVNGCGFSGPASAELEKAYGEAFGG